MLPYEIVNTVDNHRLSVPLLFTAVHDNINQGRNAPTDQNEIWEGDPKLTMSTVSLFPPSFHS